MRETETITCMETTPTQPPEPFFFLCVLPPHSQRANYIRNTHRWCVVIGKPGGARLEGTPAMDLGLKGKRIHM